MNYWISFILVIAGNVLYHLSQRQMPRGLNPFSALFAAYLGSMVLSILFVSRSGFAPIMEALSSPATWGVGLAAFMVEAGYLLLYRSGGAVSTAPITANIFVFLLLILIGLVWFREKFTWEMGLGVILCTGGLICVVRGISAKG